MLTVGERLGDGTRVVRFPRDPLAVMADAGETPLPPYIQDRSAPSERYQTVYADPAGSAAAPTAGLHFTPDLLASLAEGGVERASVTLHVGLDTFRPLEGDFIDEHHIHREWYTVPRRLPRPLDAAHRSGWRVVAVGHDERARARNGGPRSGGTAAGATCTSARRTDSRASTR